METFQQLQADFGTAFAGRRVLVTGASGFLGQHLCPALDLLGAEVHGSVRHIEPSGGPHRYHKIWKLDVRDLAQVRHVVAEVKPHFLFHLAGFASARPSADLVLPMLEHNLLGTVHALLAVAETGCERIVLVCSAEEIRSSDMSGAVTSPYGAAKMAATIYGRLFHNVHGVPVVLTRPLMAYGPRQDRTKLIPYVITSLLKKQPPQLGTGSRLCDFVYVSDVIRGFLLAATRPRLEGRMLEFGTGHATRTRDVIERLVQLAGSTIAPAYGALSDRPEEPMYPADLAATQQLVDWTPRWSLDEGLSATIAYYRSVDEPASVRLREIGEEHESSVESEDQRRGAESHQSVR